MRGRSPRTREGRIGPTAQTAVVSGQWSVVSGQWSVVSGQRFTYFRVESGLDMAMLLPEGQESSRQYWDAPCWEMTLLESGAFNYNWIENLPILRLAWFVLAMGAIHKDITPTLMECTLTKEVQMTKQLRFFSLFLIAALMLAACAAPQPAAEAPAEEAPMEEAADMSGKVVIASGGVIRIGGSFALTGPIPDPGLNIRHGAELAIDDLNAMGGLEGFMFELVAEDGACDGTQGTNVGNKFAADETIVAVTGGTCSGETFGLVPILQEARIPFVSPSATNPDITSADCDVCNRVALSDALQGATDADFVVNNLGLTQVAVVHDNSDYGKGLSEIFQSGVADLGGEVSSFEGVQVGDTDFRAMLARVGADGPQIIFFGGYSTEAGLIAQQMTETPGLEDTAFMSVDGAYTQQYLEAAGDAAEGTYISFVAGADSEEMNAEFDAKYMEKYGVSPDDLGPFHSQSYDSVKLIAAAIAAVASVDDNGNLVIDREELISAIRSVDAFEGLTGTIKCDSIGECGAGGVQIFQVSEGDFDQVSGFGME